MSRHGRTRTDTHGDGRETGPRRLAAGALIVGVFLALAVLFTWPVAAHLGTRLPFGFRDGRHRWWRYHHFRQAILRGENPFFSHLSAYPTGQNFRAADAFPPDLGAMFLLEGPLGTTAAMSVYALAQLVLAGGGAYLLGRRVGLGRPAAVVAGVAYAFHPHMSGVLHNGELPDLAIGWLPLAALALWRLGERVPTAVGEKAGSGESTDGGRWERKKWHKSLRRVLPAAGALTVLISSSTYLALAGVFMTVVVGAVLLVAALRRRRPGRMLARLALAVGLAAGAAAAVNWPRLAEVRRYPEPIRPRAPALTADLTHFLLRGTGRHELGSTASDVAFAPSYLGFALLALGVIGLMLRPRAADIVWWALLLTGCALALGPFLKVDGQFLFGPDDREHLVPLPYLRLALGLPGFEHALHSTRVLPLALVGLSMAAGLGVERLAKRVGRWGRAVAPAAGALVLADSLTGSPVPFPRRCLAVHPVAEFYRRVAAEPGEFALFEVPLSRTGEYAFAAAVHGRPLVNVVPQPGRRNSLEYTFQEQDPLARYLLRLPERGGGRAPFPDAPDTDLWRRLPVRYIIFHFGRYDEAEFPDGPAGDFEVVQHLKALFGPPVDGWITPFDEAQVFRVPEAPPSPGAEMERLRTAAEWSLRSQAQEYELAVRHFEAAVRAAPKPDPFLHYRLATLALRLGRTAAARREVRRALEIDPAYAPAQSLLATFE